MDCASPEDTEAYLEAINVHFRIGSSMYVPYEDTVGADTRPLNEQVALLSRDFAWIPNSKKNQQMRLEVTKSNTVLNLHTFYGGPFSSKDVFGFVNYKGQTELVTRVDATSTDPAKFSMIHTQLNLTPYHETRTISQSSIIGFFATFGGIMRFLEV